jgi:ornithine cyclodeaminase
LVVLNNAGDLIAIIDGETLTAQRTAAASLVAARLLIRRAPSTLAVLGAGRQAGALAEAYCRAFAISEVRIWARREEAAFALRSRLAPYCDTVRTCSTADQAIAGASIVTSATPSLLPLVRGAVVAPGTHVDLVGGFRPDMREADDELISRAFIVADGMTALQEAGDLAQPLAAGLLRAGDVHLLSDLLSGSKQSPQGDCPTIFKSVGHAGEDLIAVRLLLERLSARARNAL